MIKLTKQLYYKLRLETTKEAIDLIKGFLSVTDTVTFRIKGVLKTKTKKAPAYTPISELVIDVDYGLLEYVLAAINYAKRSLPEIKSYPVVLDLIPHSPISIIDKWESVYLSNPKGIDRGTDQLNDVEKLLKYPNGIAELYTGAGKTECLLGATETILSLYDANILITAPSNPIVEEIVLRAEKYNVSLSANAWNSRISVINPIAFFNSSRANEEAQLWMSKVTTVIHDECHHISANSYAKLYNWLPNVERVYGFSATPDVQEGTTYSPGINTLEAMSPKDAKVLGLSGLVRVKRTSPVEINLFKIMCGFADRDIKSNSWQEALSNTITSKSLARYLAKLIKNSSTKFYIPVFERDSGRQLFDNLLSFGVEGILWFGNEFLPETLNSESTHLESVKKACTSENIRFLVSTSLSFEGVDIPSLGAIIPLVGTNNRTVIQPIGRSSRGYELSVYLIYDTNNPITMSQSKSRRTRIESSYNVTKNVTIRDCWNFS